MGRTKRRYQGELLRFRKTLKRPLRNVLAIMPEGFSEELFLSEFKLLYSYLWDDICSKAKEYNRMDKGREKKGFPKIYFFPKPISYLKSIALPIIHNQGLYNQLKKPEKERVEFKRKLLKQNLCRQKNRKDKIGQNQKYIQHVVPSYSNYYIQTYFAGKHQNPTDVDTRYAVLQEASKYKSPVTVKFLYKVNASERNYHLRHFAFLTLQKFGEKEVRLRPNRKGKKRPGDKIVPNPINTPEDLIRFIYNSQLEQMKTYDLFISHSSSDSDLILKMKAILNSFGLNVYIDWVSDRNALKRELTNISTAKAIIERLKSSKALLYINTDSSFQSQWTPWELGYFHALKGDRICVYTPNDTPKPAYIDIYPKVNLVDGILVVETEDGCISLKDWLIE